MLYAGGWSLLLLALFYLVIDVWKWRRWAVPFIVIGSNSIFAYMCWQLGSGVFRSAAEVFLGGYSTMCLLPGMHRWRGPGQQPCFGCSCGICIGTGPSSERERDRW
jgi:hypothetical protein